MATLPASKNNTLATQIHPPDFSGAQPYTDQVGRTKLTIGEGLVDCFAFGTHLTSTSVTSREATSFRLPRDVRARYELHFLHQHRFPRRPGPRGQLTMQVLADWSDLTA